MREGGAIPGILLKRSTALKRKKGTSKRNSRRIKHSPQVCGHRNDCLDYRYLQDLKTNENIAAIRKEYKTIDFPKGNKN